MDNTFLIAGLIFVLVMLVGLLAFHYWGVYSTRKDIGERLRKEGSSRENNESLSSDPKWKLFFMRTVSKFGEAVGPKKEADVSRNRKTLLKAGFYGEKGPLVFFGSKVFMALFVSVITVVVKFTLLKTLPAQWFLTLLIVSVAAGFYLPDLYLYHRTQDRKKKIFEAFPDALDLMVVCVEAGMGLDSAIKRVGDEMGRKSKPLSDEFRLLSLELRAGKPRPEALRNLAARTDLEDVTSLATLLIQTDKFGTRVAQALRVHSDSMRTKRYQRAEEIAAKLPVKIVFPLILFIFPALLVTIIGPAVIRIYRSLITH